MILNFISKESKEAIEYFESLPIKRRMQIIAKFILDTNNKKIAEQIFNKKLNDIEYMDFKRFLKKLLF